MVNEQKRAASVPNLIKWPGGGWIKASTMRKTKTATMINDRYFFFQNNNKKRVWIWSNLDFLISIASARQNKKITYTWSTSSETSHPLLKRINNFLFIKKSLIISLIILFDREDTYLNLKNKFLSIDYVLFIFYQ